MLWLALLSLVVGVSPARANKQYGPGVTDTQITIGGTVPYSGPVSVAGDIGRTQLAFFRMINDHGGVNGRKIHFISLDDGYSPPKTFEQTRKLVEEEHVLLIFGTVGTPTNMAIRKYLNIKKVPQLFISSGASGFGDPQNYPWTMGFQPNYRSEGAIYGRYILDTIKNAKLAILYQNDDFGKDYLSGIKLGLGNEASKLIVQTASYEVSEPTVDSQVIALHGSSANVFLNASTPKFSAQAIRQAYDIGWHPTQFLDNLSTSISSTLVQAGVKKAVGIISANYLKEPSDPAWANDKDVRDYLAFMKKYAPGIDAQEHFALQGYVTAEALVQVLKQCGNDLTRANVMKQAANLKNLELPMLLPGILVNTSPTRFYPVEQEELMKFNGKTWVRFGKVFDAS